MRAVPPSRRWRGVARVLARVRRRRRQVRQRPILRLRHARGGRQGRLRGSPRPRALRRAMHRGVQRRGPLHAHPGSSRRPPHRAGRRRRLRLARARDRRNVPLRAGLRPQRLRGSRVDAREGCRGVRQRRRERRRRPAPTEPREESSRSNRVQPRGGLRDALPRRACQWIGWDRVRVWARDVPPAHHAAPRRGVLRG